MVDAFLELVGEEGGLGWYRGLDWRIWAWTSLRSSAGVLGDGGGREVTSQGLVVVGCGFEFCLEGTLGSEVGSLFFRTGCVSVEMTGG